MLKILLKGLQWWLHRRHTLWMKHNKTKTRYLLKQSKHICTDYAASLQSIPSPMEGPGALSLWYYQQYINHFFLPFLLHFTIAWGRRYQEWIFTSKYSLLYYSHSTTICPVDSIAAIYWLQQSIDCNNRFQLQWSLWWSFKGLLWNERKHDYQAWCNDDSTINDLGIKVES